MEKVVNVFEIGEGEGDAMCSLVEWIFFLLLLLVPIYVM